MNDPNYPETRRSYNGEVIALITGHPLLAALAVLIQIVDMVIVDLAWAVSEGYATPDGQMLPKSRDKQAYARGAYSGKRPTVDDLQTACEFVRGAGEPLLDVINEAAARDLLSMSRVRARIAQLAEPSTHAATPA